MKIGQAKSRIGSTITNTSDDCSRETASDTPRGLFNFRLRSLLAAVTLVGLLFGAYGIFVTPYMEQAEVREQILSEGFACVSRPAPPWLTLFIGHEKACVVTAVDLRKVQTGNAYCLTHPEDILPVRQFADEKLLLQLGKLTELEAINVSGQNVTDEIIGSWESLTRLRVLNVSNTLIEDAESWPEFPLAMLDVSSTMLRDEHAASLNKYPQLTALNLSNTTLTDNGVQELTALHKLQKLWLIDTPVTDASCAWLNSLEQLDLLRVGTSYSPLGFSIGRYSNLASTIKTTNAETTNDGVECSRDDAAIAAARESLSDKLAEFLSRSDPTRQELTVSRLELLHLDLLEGNERIHNLDLHGHIPDGQLAYVATLPNLQRLNLNESYITDEGIQPLGDCAGLEVLWLNDVPITDAGLAHLTGLKRLKLIGLGGTGTTDVGIGHLAKITSLERAILTDTNITEAGLAAFAGHPNLIQLMLPTRAINDASGLAYLCEVPQLQFVDFRENSWRSGFNRLSRISRTPLAAESIEHFEKLAAHCVAQIPPLAQQSLVLSDPDLQPLRLPTSESFQDYLLARLLIDFELSDGAIGELPQDVLDFYGATTKKFKGGGVYLRKSYQPIGTSRSSLLLDLN